MASPNNLSTLLPEILDRESKISIDALIDTLIALYYDSNVNALKRKHKTIDRFLTVYEKEIKNLLTKYDRRKIQHFDELKLLGQGAFGCVKLVRDRISKEVYAMKTLNKNYMNKKGIQESNANFMEERQILINGNSSPWVIKLHYSFQDKSSLYMVMEFMAGGDLVKLMERYSLPNRFLRFYAMEIILGIEAIHNMGYLHRDIKPDNILIDRQGHIKLGDFGTCIKMDSDKRVRFGRAVGTPDYVPPEFLQAEGRLSAYGPESDYWSFGVVLYELIFNDVPFYGEDNNGIYQKILNHKTSLVFPKDDPDADCPPDCEDFIRNLITSRQTRFGQKGSTKEIRAHRWFNSKDNDYDWENIRSQPVPIVPELKSDTDTSYFDEVERNTDKDDFDEMFGNENREFMGTHLPFIGFSYNTIPGVENLSIGGNSNNNVSLSDTQPSSLAHSGPLKMISQISSEADQENLKKLRAQEEEVKKVLKAKADLEHELKKEKENIIKLRTINKELDVKMRTQEFRQKTMAINPPTPEVTELKAKIAEISNLLKKAENDKRLEIEKFNTLNLEKRSEESKIQNLESQLKQTRTQISLLTRNKEEFEHQLVEKNEKCKVFETKLKAAEQNLHLYKTQQRTTGEHYQNIINDKKLESKKLQDELNMVKINLSNAENARNYEAEKLANLKREKQNLENQILNLKEQNNNISNELQNQKSQVKDSYQFKKASLDINAKLSETIKALTLKTSQLELEKRKYDDISNKLSEKDNIISEKNNVIDELNRQKDWDEKNRVEINQKTANLQNELTEKIMENERLDQKLKDLTLDTGTLSDTTRNLKIKIEQYEGQMKELADELDTEQKFNHMYKNQIQDLEINKAEWDQEKEIIEKDVRFYKQEFANMKAVVKAVDDNKLGTEKEFQAMAEKLVGLGVGIFHSIEIYWRRYVLCISKPLFIRPRTSPNNPKRNQPRTRQQVSHNTNFKRTDQIGKRNSTTRNSKIDCRKRKSKQ